MSGTAAAPSRTARNKAARLMAVQAVYQMAVNNKEAGFVVDEYMHLRKGMEIDGEKLVEPDEPLFRDIVLGVAEQHAVLTEIVQANRPLKEGRIRVNEPLLEAHFLCGCFELLSHHTIDKALIISSYVDVAKAFFEGPEPGLVNAVLDSAAKVIRS
ncbi:MAG: transcription antitermination factor NusB [Micavibrio sp.]